MNFLSVILLQASYNSRIILTEIATYYSQNYAGTLGSSLLYTWVYFRAIRVVLSDWVTIISITHLNILKTISKGA